MAVAAAAEVAATPRAQTTTAQTTQAAESLPPVGAQKSQATPTEGPRLQRCERQLSLQHPKLRGGAETRSAKAQRAATATEAPRNGAVAHEPKS